MEQLLEALRAGSDFLSRPLFKLGTAPISTSSLIKLAAFLLAAFWISKVARLALGRVLARRRLAQATLYALDRLLNYTILTIGILIGLSAIGIDFTTFAVLAGALGVGIGFGLQPLVANFVSGIILLLDRRIRVTDFIELESGLTGQVKMINTFGVAYGSDKEVVRTAALEAAESVPEELVYHAVRKPQVWFVEFGESSLNFELLVWLGPQNIRRPAAVKAAYLWEIHSALERHGIEVPFPQRDLHLKSLLGMTADEARALLERRGEE